MNGKKLTESLKLKAVELEIIASQLKSLTTANPMVPELAYASNANSNVQFACRGCDGGCKGSCSGGCTSW